MNRTARKALVFAAVLAAVLAVATGAFAWITASGGGQGTAVGGSLTPVVPDGATPPTGKPRISWTPAQVRPDDAAKDADVTYLVDRSSNGGSSWTAAAGTCAGTLASGTLTCDDDPPVGSYEYRVAASYRSWSTTGTTGIVSTRNTTSLGLVSPSTAATGVAISSSALQAALSGATGAPAAAGGTVIVSYFGPQAAPPATCQTSGAGWTELGTVSVAGDGTYSPAAGSFTPAAPGTYWWYASYGGDTLNFGTATACGAGEASTVVTNTTATALTAPAAGTVGTAIPLSQVSAALSGGTSSPAAGGTVTFSYFGPQGTPPLVCETSGGGWTAAGTASVSGNGSYSAGGSFTPAAPGTYWWYASYSGDTLNGVSTSECDASMAASVISRAQPSLSLGAPAAGTAGTAIDPATITASLTGRVTPDTSGNVSFFFVEQSAAPSSCTAGTAIGSAVTESAAATYSPSASFTPMTAGTYWLYAVYSGDLDNLDATSACPPAAAQEIQVAPAQPVVTLSVAGGPAPLTIGQTFAAGSIAADVAGRVSQDGTGKVEFFYTTSTPAACASGTLLGTPVAETNSDTYTPNADFTPTTPGSYWIYAVYSGDANNDAASGSCPPAAAQEIDVAAGQPALTLAVAGAPLAVATGTPVAAASITATLNGRVNEDGTGSIKFYYVASPVAPTGCSTGTPIGIGTAVTETAATAYNPNAAFTPTAAGTYWLYAVYSGDSTNDGASGTCTPTSAQEVQVTVAP